MIRSIICKFVAFLVMKINFDFTFFEIIKSRSGFELRVKKGFRRVFKKVR